MTVFLYTTFLSLFLLQVHLGSAISSFPDNKNPSGGQLMPRNYFWPSQFDLQKARVFVNLNGAYYQPYIICPNDKPNTRGFLIKYFDETTVLEGQEDGTARCGHAHTYVDSPHVNYTVDAHRGKTDKWWMSVLAKDGTTDDFIYHRSKDSTTGDVRYNKNGTLAATIRFSSQGTPQGPVQVIVLDIQPPVSVETKYFIGLWMTVKLRWDRCHK